MTRAVLDSSAVLAFLRREPGHERVGAYVGWSLISAANYHESVCKLVDHGATAAEANHAVRTLMLAVKPVTEHQAILAAVIHEQTRGRGLSLGDRLCLALGRDFALSVVTADRAWANLSVGVQIELLR